MNFTFLLPCACTRNSRNMQASPSFTSYFIWAAVCFSLFSPAVPTPTLASSSQKSNKPNEYYDPITAMHPMMQYKTPNCHRYPYAPRPPPIVPLPGHLFWFALSLCVRQRSFFTVLPLSITVMSHIGFLLLQGRSSNANYHHVLKHI